MIYFEALKILHMIKPVTSLRAFTAMEMATQMVVKARRPESTIKVALPFAKTTYLRGDKGVSGELSLRVLPQPRNL